MQLPVPFTILTLGNRRNRIVSELQDERQSSRREELATWMRSMADSSLDMRKSHSPRLFVIIVSSCARVWQITNNCFISRLLEQYAALCGKYYVEFSISDHVCIEFGHGLAQFSICWSASGGATVERGLKEESNLLLNCNQNVQVCT